MPVIAGLPGGAWEGFGINWNAVPYNRSGSTSARKLQNLGSPALWHILPWQSDVRQLQVDEQRILALRPAYVRMSWSIDWFDPSYTPGDYQWNTTAMQDRYRVLTFLQNHGIPVITGMWVPPQDTVRYGSQAWVLMETALVSHLAKARHFSNIRYWISGNEPNGHVCTDSDCTVSLPMWESATNRLHTAFRQAHLLPGVQLIGPTASGRFPWNRWSASRHSTSNWPRDLASSPTMNNLGAVDWHEYIQTRKPDHPPTGISAYRSILNTSAQKATANIVDSIHSGTYGAGKRTILSEFGFQGISSSRSNGVPTYGFSLGMLNFGIDVAKSGVNAASVWELDPDVVGLRIAADGLWPSSSPYLPYFLYSATSMLMHAAPAGAVIEPVTVGAPAKLNVLAARVGKGNNQGWAVLMVNNTSQTQWAQVQGLTGASNLAQYDFSQTHQSVPFTGQTNPDFVIVASGGRTTAEIGPHSAALLTG